MKTSPSQFEMLVAYMEQHGDLCELSTSNARGRITTLQNWEELAALLNSDGAGATKTTEKWKKAWSDLKNNTKKKAARLNRAASGTGGGPALFAKLTLLESRILNLMGTQVATGLAVEEAGLSQDVDIQARHNKEQCIQTIYGIEESQSPPPSSLMRAISSPPLMFKEQKVQSSQPNHREPEPSTSTVAQAHTSPQARPTMAAPHIISEEAQVEEMGLLSPTIPSSRVRVGHGFGPPVPTPPRQARRRARPPHTEQAAQHFLQADLSWRLFKEQQHRDSMELKREQNRISLMQLQVQRDWQKIGEKFLNVLEKVADKYCKD